MKTKPYKYLGNRATTICKNGHFGIWTVNSNCDVCGEPKEPLRIFTNTTRLPVTILGYLVKEDAAIIQHEDTTKVKVERQSFNKEYYCPTVIDWNLTVSRLFSWAIITV